MSILYKNVTSADAYIEDDIGRKKLVRRGETFEGSAYFRRYADADPPILSILSDDGSYWIDGAAYAGAGHVPKSYELTIVSGTDFTDPGNTVNLFTDLGEPAIALQVKNANQGAAIKMRLNGLAVVTVDTGETVNFDINELLVTKLEFRNEQGSDANVEVLAVGR